MYPFDGMCPYRLEVSYKQHIVCNSSYNAQQKCVHGMPHGYLNLSVRQGLRLMYSYYIDLEDKVSADDLQKGFKRLYRDIVKQ